MAADVRSIAEVRDFHAALTVYRATLLEAMGGVDMEVRRAFDWLSETASLWQRRVRDGQEELTQAKAELSARRFPGYDGRMPDCTVQEENLRRAKAKLEFCEEQVRKCRSWINKLPKQVEEAYTGSGRRLENFLEVNFVERALAPRPPTGGIGGVCRPPRRFRPGPVRGCLDDGPSGGETRCGRGWKWDRRSVRRYRGLKEHSAMRVGATRSQIYDAQKTARGAGSRCRPRGTTSCAASSRKGRGSRSTNR